MEGDAQDKETIKKSLNILRGKKLAEFFLSNNGEDDFINFVFDDGIKLSIGYETLYELCLLEKG